MFMEQGAIQQFSFSSHSIRVSLDAQGDPWFVATDVAKVLDHANPTMMVAGLDDEDRGVSKVETPGGAQSLTTLSESGLYTVLLRSNKPEAKPFRRWVTKEVLPSIRKTGSYSVRQEPQPAPMQILPGGLTDQVASIVLLTQAIAASHHIVPQLATTAMLAACAEAGVRGTRELARMLPPIAPADMPKHNATELGKLLRMAPRDVNQMLLTLGLQEKTSKGWVLTDKGAEHGASVPYTRGGHSGFQILWKDSVVPALEAETR